MTRWRSIRRSFDGRSIDPMYLWRMPLSWTQGDYCRKWGVMTRHARMTEEQKWPPLSMLTKASTSTVVTTCELLSHGSRAFHWTSLILKGDLCNTWHYGKRDVGRKVSFVGLIALETPLCYIPVIFGNAAL